MRSRILVACVCIPLLLAIMFLCPFWATVLLVALLSAIAAYELLNCIGATRFKRVTGYCVVVSFAVPFWCWLGCPSVLGTWGVFCLFLLLFIEAIFSNKEIDFQIIAAAMFSALLIPYFMSAFVRIGMVDKGRTMILVPLVVSFVADGAALFAGMAFGKHKLAPKISPKKTVEGAIGGFIGGILGCVIYALVAERIWAVDMSVASAAVYGAVGSLVSMVGDLSFSLIKRQYGIKDYGNILPGHGGILDRFDSVIFAAPLVELMTRILPVVK